MQSFFSDPGGVGRDIALRSLRRDIVGLIGGPVEIHDAVFIDAPLADFFVTERQRDLYAIRWLDSQDFASGLTRTLSAYARLHEAGKTELSRALGLPLEFSPATLVLVSDRVDDDWIRVVSTLRIPVILLRAHSLVDGTRHSAGCLFEKCYAARAAEPKPSGGFQPESRSSEETPLQAPAEVAAASPPEEDPAGSSEPAPAPTTELQPDDRPIAPRESSAALDLRQISRTIEEEPPAPPTSDPDTVDSASYPVAVPVPSGRPERPEQALHEAPVPTEANVDSESIATESRPPEPDVAREGPHQFLSEEEIATFRLLENVLESTR